MRIRITENYEEMSRHAAQIVASHLTIEPKCVLGLATGGTVVGMYKRLIELHEAEGLDFSKSSAFNLDEYYPIQKTDPQSYASFMQENLFKFVNFRAEATQIPNGEAADIEDACIGYERQIREAGGIDLQILGIGRNGHIGFNEPNVTFEARTHRVKLDEQTIQDNARYFGSIEEVPKEAISMGIKTIMHAKKILLLASGEEKSDAISRMIYGKITPNLPASVLQLHPNVTLVIDKAAASKLPEELVSKGNGQMEDIDAELV